MKKLTRKLACVMMALMLLAGVLTGCSTESDTQWYLHKSISLQEKYGTLPKEGTVGNLDYRILEKGAFSCYESEAGYYIDMLEEPDSPYFIVITLGSKANDAVEIVDLGMDGTTLQIVIAHADAAGDESDSKSSPCCVLQVNQMPGSIEIHDRNGRTYELIEK